MRLFELFALAASAVALQEGSCDYSIDGEEEGNDYCIQETVRVETEFSFEPLFPDGVRFVYAADNVNTSEFGGGIYETDPALGTLGSLAAWWLEYDEISLDNGDAVYGTKMRTIYLNTTESTGGDNNGCDDLLGSECVSTITDKLKELVFSLEDYQDPLLYITDQFEANWEEEIGDACPEALSGHEGENWFDIDIREGTSNDLGSFELGYLATEMPDDAEAFEFISESAAMPSGNWSLTYYRWLESERPFSEQLGLAAVTILIRSPARDSPTNSDMDFTEDDVQVAVVCAKPSQEQFDEFAGTDEESGGDEGGSGGSGGSGGGDDDAATVAHAPFVAVMAVALGTAYWVIDR